jgi:hypothetical protein
MVLKDTKAAKKSKIRFKLIFNTITINFWKFNHDLILTIFKIYHRHGIDRLVEDLIQESIAKGEFTNLKGVGKPLETQNHNPYIDVVTHKINQVLCN